MRQKTHFRIKRGSNGRGRGGGGRGSRHEFTNNNFAFHESQIVYLISVKCLGDLYVTINSLV